MEVPSIVISSEYELESLSADNVAVPGTSKSPHDRRKEDETIPVSQKSTQHNGKKGNMNLAETLPFYSMQPEIEFESPDYFSHLVKTHSTTQGLPKRYLDILGDRQLERRDLWQPGNAFVSQLKLFALLKNHMRLSLIHEYEKILEASSVSNEQLDKVFAILKMHDECPVPKYPSSLMNSSAPNGLGLSHPIWDSGDRAIAPLIFDDMSFGDFIEMMEQRQSQKPEVNPEKDEHVPEVYDEAGEQKVMATGHLSEGRVYRFQTFSLPDRGETLFALASECAQVLGYNDSDQLFDRHRRLFKVMATEAEKECLVDREILPGLINNPEVAIITAYSLFRVFGHEVVVNGKAIQDDYWTTDLQAIGSIGEGSARELGGDNRGDSDRITPKLEFTSDFTLFPISQTVRRNQVKRVNGLHSSKTSVARSRSKAVKILSAQTKRQSHSGPMLQNSENSIKTWKDTFNAFTSFILPVQSSINSPPLSLDVEAQEDTELASSPTNRYVASPPTELVSPGTPRLRFENIRKIFATISTPHALRGVFSTPQAEREFFRERKITAYKRMHGFPLRFITALLGGLSLIGPMLIMAINEDRTKSLVTASVCVLLFALGLAWAVPATPQELLGATAAYAAVLVVFVGVSS